MKEIIKTNRRKTSRFDLNIPGEVYLNINGLNFTEPVEVVNISYEGIQIVFSNNSFLYDFLESYESLESEINITFKYNDKNYSFSTKILWIRLYNLGERYFYVLSGLTYKDRTNVDDNLMSILLGLEMKDVYIGNVS